MVEKPLVSAVSIIVEGQAALVALEGPLSLSFIAYGSSMILIFAPYGSTIFVFGRSMLVRETHGVNVSFEGEIPHTFFTTCSNGKMGYDMVTLIAHFSLYEVSHMMEEMPYDDDFQLIIYGDTWANLICSVGGEIFGGLVLIFPLKGKLIAAHGQPTLYTYHRWRYG